MSGKLSDELLERIKARDKAWYWDQLTPTDVSQALEDRRALLEDRKAITAENERLQKFSDEVCAALANEGPHTIEHLLATASLGKRTTVIGRSRLSQLHKAEDDLAQWQRFASYCRSCALSGESDPMTFEQFIEHGKDAT